MKISLAIPIFRQESFLPSAMESVFVQQKNIQLAVMDATPDDSVQVVLERYRDLLSYHRHGADSGQTAAIQEGWDNTDGDVIAWLCADDYYFPYTIELVKKIFIEHPEIDVVYGDSVFVDETNRFLGYFPAINQSISAITKECCVSQPSCFVRRAAFDQIGGRLNEKLHYIMDWDLWTRLYHSGAKFYYLNKPLSVVRMYEGTKTSSRSWRRFFEISRHLFLNATPLQAVRSMVGFYYQDLLSCRGNSFEMLILKFLNLYQTYKSRNLDSENSNSYFNYGFSNKNNIVCQQIDIYLPWYDVCPPKKVLVNCDLDSAPTAYFNGKQLLVDEGTNYLYPSTDVDNSTQILHLQLTSTVDCLWHLYDVKFM
jgi:glycosyltransferase involved in cell wall biosynthesis